MPVPVISSTLLKNVFAVGETFTIQLGATNTPTEWAISVSDTLPAGVFFDSTAGTLFGNASSAGIYRLNFTATNADGDSAEQGFDIGFFNVKCDTHFRQASINMDTMVATLSPDWAKINDDCTFEITLTSSQATCMPEASMIQFALKNEDGIKYLQSDVVAFAQETIFNGTGYIKKYYVFCALDAPQLVSDVIGADEEYIDLKGEFQLAVNSNSSAGSASNKISTQTFTFRVYKDIVE